MSDPVYMKDVSLIEVGDYVWYGRRAFSLGDHFTANELCDIGTIRRIRTSDDTDGVWYYTISPTTDYQSLCYPMRAPHQVRKLTNKELTAFLLFGHHNHA